MSYVKLEGDLVRGEFYFPEDKVLPVSDLREELSTVLNRVGYGNDRFAITRNNNPVAALVSIADLQALQFIQDRADYDRIKELAKEANMDNLAEEKELELQLEGVD
jgi:prevent-host-death family protein